MVTVVVVAFFAGFGCAALFGLVAHYGMTSNDFDAT